MKQENKNGKTFINLKPTDNEQWFIKAGVDATNTRFIFLQDTVVLTPYTTRIDICENFTKKVVANKLIINSNSTYIELSELNCSRDIDESYTFTSAKDINDYINSIFFIQ